jgi:trehalose 6-phosphate synthase/phosphatase
MPVALPERIAGEFLAAVPPPASATRELVIASNRLPVRIATGPDGVQAAPTAGGLATALSGVGGIASWIGWPGEVVAPELELEVTAQLADSGLRPLFLDATEEREFYGRICNDTLWPLFHYFPHKLAITGDAWACYRHVNERFAAAIADSAAPGARVWIHDFHLLLVPEMLRGLRPDVSIGFFLHIPFPSSEVYRLLPPREEVLRGLLGADYVGFHTGDYARHFRSACLRVLGLESEPDEIRYEGRSIGVGVDPIGIDTAAFRATLADPETESISRDLEDRYYGRRLVLGVERLDYTKGIPQRLRIFERFLEEDPTRAKTTTMLLVVVPSRLDSDEYVAQRDEIELLIARINGRFGQPGLTPVEYLHRSVGRSELVALYRRADVMMVTPLRDGMNLVAQEFALSQAAEGPPVRHRGTLLLSEFAGAARVLPGALLVNPWDIDGTATKLADALDLGRGERRRRLDTMAARVEDLDSGLWATRFLTQLDLYAAAERCPSALDAQDPRPRGALLRRFADAGRRTLLLDYDGTLREFEALPELAAPTSEITSLLGRLASLPATDVHIVSGRQPETLEQWFGELPVHLCAEHGVVARTAGANWRTLVHADLSWLPEIEEFLAEQMDDVPGGVLEKKRYGVAWHYRQAEPEYGVWRARELRVALEQRLARLPVEVLSGNRVIEVRAQGVHKGVYVRHLFERGVGPSELVIAAGDDRTDRQMLEALPQGAVGIHVGALAAELDALGCVAYTLDSPADVRALLGELALAAAATTR